MKKIFTTLSLFAMALGVFAIPAKRGIWKTLPMADGTQVEAQLTGDENLHYWQASDGRQLVEQDGRFELANMEQLRANAQTRMSSANRHRSERQAKAAIGDFTHYTGQKKGLIILVEFTDMHFQESNDQALYDRICNEPGFSEGNFRGSVYDYFKAQSYNQFELTFDVVGPVQMSQGYAYYGQDSGGQGDDIRPGLMVATACQAIVDEVNFADYDWDGDGVVDQVMCIYAGQGQADGGNSNTIWPHEWELSSSDYGQSLTLDGVVIDTYAVANERRSSNIEGIGTICHEFSHCLGLPDMYDILYGGNYGMGEWSLMDMGSYNGDGFCPSGYSSFDRYTCGWVKPVELNRNQTIENLRPLSEKGDVYMVRNDAWPDEYYLIENRQLKGWDAELPRRGMLILHVDFDKTIWEYNLVNTNMSASNYYGYPANDHQRCTMFRPGGNSSYSTYDTYPYDGLDSLTNLSTPSAIIYHPNAEGNMLMDRGILDITQLSNGNMSFRYRNAASERYVPYGALLYETFNDCIGSGGNDDIWIITMASSALFTDNEGWEAESAYGGYRCARFGARSKVGTATTPAFRVDGEAKLSFRAAGWQGDGTTLKLSLEGDSVSIDQQEFTMVPFQWSEFTATLKGTGTTRLTFQPDKRFLLDDVLVLDPVVAGITTTKSTPQPAEGREGFYNLQGQRVQRPGRGLYIKDGKKILIR